MKLSHALAALPLAVALGGPGSAHAVTSSTLPGNWVLSPGDFGGAFDGVAKLLFNNSEGSFVCSGSLLSGGQYVLTAAHCADNFTSMTVDFQLGSVVRNAAAAYVHPGWNGTLGNGSDIAIIRLDAPVSGIAGFNISTTNDLGKDMLLAGYGAVGTGGTGSITFDRNPDGSNWQAHYGYNTADITDFALNEGVFGPGSGDNTYGETYVFDFDNGRVIRNALQRLKNKHGASWADSSTGLGDNEGLIAGGDSGGGDFVWTGSEWVLSGVHSYGWGLCGDLILCDKRRGTNSSYGDLSGSTAVFSHAAWINSVVAVPEPSTYAMMFAGLGLIGWLARRRQRQA